MRWDGRFPTKFYSAMERKDTREHTPGMACVTGRQRLW